ncbi:hypothetical protein D3C76_1385360 [compost metagenome]
MAQVGAAGRVTGLDIALRDGLQQSIDIADAHAGAHQVEYGGLKGLGGHALIAGQPYPGCCQAGATFGGGGGVGVVGAGRGRTLPALQPLLLFQLLQGLLLIAQLLAGRVVGKRR